MIMVRMTRVVVLTSIKTVLESEFDGKGQEKRFSCQWFTIRKHGFFYVSQKSVLYIAIKYSPFYILATVHFSTFQWPGHCVLSQAMHLRAFRAVPTWVGSFSGGCSALCFRDLVAEEGCQPLLLVSITTLSLPLCGDGDLIVLVRGCGISADIIGRLPVLFSRSCRMRETALLLSIMDTFSFWKSWRWKRRRSSWVWTGRTVIHTRCCLLSHWCRGFWSFTNCSSFQSLDTQLHQMAGCRILPVFVHSHSHWSNSHSPQQDAGEVLTKFFHED